MIQITPHAIWLGNIRDAADPGAYHERGIEAIVQLAAEESHVNVSRELVSLRVPLLDGEGNRMDDLRMVVEFVADFMRCRRPVLICCSAGMSRSPAIAAFALSRVAGKPPRECLLAIQERTPTDVSPGLWRALLALDG